MKYFSKVIIIIVRNQLDARLVFTVSCGNFSRFGLTGFEQYYCISVKVEKHIMLFLWCDMASVVLAHYDVPRLWIFLVEDFFDIGCHVIRIFILGPGGFKGGRRQGLHFLVHVGPTDVRYWCLFLGLAHLYSWMQEMYSSKLQKIRVQLKNLNLNPNFSLSTKFLIENFVLQTFFKLLTINNKIPK